MNLRIPETLRNVVPQIGPALAKFDPMVWLKLTCEEAGWAWYIIAVEALTRNGQEPSAFVRRHWRGDWGLVDAADAAHNAFALANGLRLLSAYALNDGMTMWIITEADRSVTTLLLPEEY